MQDRSWWKGSGTGLTGSNSNPAGKDLTWPLVLAVPVLACLIIFAIAEKWIPFPTFAADQACPPGRLTLSVPAAPSDVGVSLRLERAGLIALPPAPWPSCNVAAQADAPLPGVDRAGALLAIALGVALIFGTVMLYYCFSALLAIVGWGISLLAVVLSALLGGVAIAWWLPHQATVEILNLLNHAGDTGRAAATRGGTIATYGCFAVVFVATMYLAALAAMATEPRPQRCEADWKAVELSRRFERLTTLSSISSIAFVLAILVQVLLMQWPQAIPDLGPAVGSTAAVMTALLGAYMTAILIGAYLPATLVLEDFAGRAARDAEPGADLAKIKAWLAVRGLTVVSTTRVIAAVATLVPLLAGALSGLASIPTALTLR